MRLLSLLPVGLAVFISACGGSDRSPASPTPSQPVVTTANVAIVGPQVVLTGSSVTYSATATLSTGARISNARPTTWSIDNTDVAMINGASDGIGELTGRGQGTATITATYQGASGTFSVLVRAASEQAGGANLAISFKPDPVTGSRTACPGLSLPPPTWTFTEVIAETAGVGFKLETITLNLYDENEKIIYLSSEPEEDYFPPNSVFEEEFCTSLFASGSGYYSDSWEGVDDRGNRLAFASRRLRLLPVAGASPTASRIPFAPTAVPLVVRKLHRVR